MAANILASLESIRKSVAATLEQLPAILQDFASDGDLERHVDDLETTKERLVVQRDRYSKLHELLLVTSVEDAATQGDVTAACVRDSEKLLEIDSLVAKYSAAILRLTRKRSLSNSNGNGAGDGTRSESDDNHSPVKLPRLDLPTFDGDVLKWSEWWDSFKSAVHEKRICDADKMTFLKASLSGSARQAVVGLFSGGAVNYQQAIKLLERRFGDKSIIINSHYSALSSLPVASSGNGKLRETFDLIEQHVNSLEALGENVKNSQMASLIKSKLPVGVVIRLEEQHGTALDVDKLRDKIHSYLLIRESAEHGRSSSLSFDLPSTKPKREWQHSPPRHHSTQRYHSPQRQSRSSASSLMASTTPQKQCAFCKTSSHWATECEKYPTIEDRKKRISGLCYNCLGEGHLIADCNRRKPCFYCKQVKHHHSSLCPKEFSLGISKNSASNSLSSVTQNPSTATSSMDKSASVSILAPTENVLLQTASTEIRGIEQETSAAIRLILDTGSDRNYITKAMAKRLKLPVKHVARLNVFTFGDRSRKYIDAEVVELQIKLCDGSYMTIEAHSIPTITGEFNRSPIDFSPYQALYGALPLADSVPTACETFKPDFLIGLDDYWNVVTAEKIMLSEGLYLIGSKFGWLLTGRYKPAGGMVWPALSTSDTLMVCASGFTTLTLDDE